jgi:ATP-binding cassette subfamily B protein
MTDREPQMPLSLQQRVRETWELGRFAFDTLVAPWPPFALLLIVTTLLGGLIPLLRIRLTTGLINALTAHPAMPSESLFAVLRPYLPWLLPLILIMVLNWLIYMDTFQRYLSTVLTERVRERFDEQFLQQALALRLEQFESPATFDTLERAHRAMEFQSVMANSGVSYRLTTLQRLLSTACGSLAILWALARVSPAIALGLLVGNLWLIRWNLRAERALIELDYTQAPLLRRCDYWRDLLTQRAAATELRLFQLGDYMLQAWRRLTQQRLDELSAARRTNFYRRVPSAVANILLYGAVVLGLLAVAAQGRLSAGGLVAFLYALQDFRQHVRNNTGRLEVLQRFFSELRYVPAFYALEGEVRDEGLPAPELRQEAICFEGVGFTYPGSRRPALSDIRLRIQPGERIALVGENGAGKSTLVKLLLGLYQPTEGKITVAGTDLRAIAPQAWRARVGAVLQDYMRYALTARENIGFGRLDKLDDLEAIQTAAQRSSAAAVIHALPKGYETVLGKEFEEGCDLSLGQWQKLALARAYLRDADVLVLDEPASALDALAEQEVYRQFLSLSEGKTVLLISHRLGSARLADRILFLEQGRIVQAGTHAELMAAGGPYADLYAMQAAWYQETGETTNDDIAK